MRSPGKTSLMKILLPFHLNCPCCGRRRTQITDVSWYSQLSRIVRGVAIKSRDFNVQGLMRPMLVVSGLKAIEGIMLGPTMRCRRIGCLRLQRAMHSLMATVLFRMTSGNPLRDDAQFHPVNRQRRQTSNGSGGKGRVVVGAIASGQDHTRERRLKEGSELLGVGLAPLGRAGDSRLAASLMGNGSMR